MSIAKGGFKCDICGKMIFLESHQKLKPMRMVGIDRLLHVHNPSGEYKCYEQVIHAMKMKNYRLLPYGPLKEMYYQAIKEEKALQDGGNGRIS